MGTGRTGGRARGDVAARSRALGRAGRPGRIRKVEALLDLLGGAASVDQLAERLGVRGATIVRWREEALPRVRRVLLEERESPRATGGPGGKESSTVGSTPPRTSKTEAMKLFLLEEYVRVSKPGPRQVAAMSRQTPYGKAPVAMVCKVFGIGRTAYYEALRQRPALGEAARGRR